MTNLADAQKSFAAALHNISIAPPANIRGPRIERRFAVYRNNVAVGLISALATRYPVVKRLVGDEFFREMARSYVMVEPPRSPIMLYYGEKFPDFIESFEPARPVPYLAAIARIEMARGLAYHAADAQPVAAGDFAALPPQQFAQLRMTFHPSISIITSPYPVYSIWSVNQSRAPAVPVSPWTAEAALIARPLHTVEVTKLTAGEAEFLGALTDGRTMAEAVETALDNAADFDVSQVIALLIKARIVVGFGRPTRHQTGN
jgi:hypothetical protein